MFSRQLVRQKMLYKLAFKNSLAVRPSAIRYFSSGVNNVENDTETIVEDQDYYTPTRKINIEKGTFTFFDNQNHNKEQMAAPYEVKETVIKNGIGMIVTCIVDSAMFPMSFVPTTLFALNMCYRVVNYMSKAVDHVDLMN